jgi:hypothetical protein
MGIPLPAGERKKHAFLQFQEPVAKIGGQIPVMRDKKVSQVKFLA